MRFLLQLLRRCRRPLPFLLVILPVAVLIGRLFPQLAAPFQSLGLAAVGLYLLPTIPIVITSITLAFDRLISENRDRRYLLRLVLITTAGCLLVAAIGLLCAYGWKVGSLSASAQQAVGQLIDQGSDELRVYLRSEPPQKPETPLLTLLIDLIVPSNLMAHISKNETLKILIASAAFGLTFNRVPDPLADRMRLFLTGLNAISIRLLDLLLDLSPLIILMLVASAAATINIPVLLGLLTFLAAFLSGCLILLAIACLILRLRHLRHAPTPASAQPADSLEASISSEGPDATEVFMLGITTSNSLALFSSITRMLRFEHFSEQQVDTTIVLHLLVTRAGNILYNAMAILFAINFYDLPLTPSLLLKVLLLAILAGLAATGLSGVATVPVITIALNSLQIPVGPILVLLLAIDPLLVMLRASSTGVASLGSAILICDHSSPPPLDAPPRLQ
jgi:Na+/H+-dicarboxylate symporter